MKTYISVNIVSQALILMSAIKKHDCDSIREVVQLKLPYGINCDAAIIFSQQCGWIITDNDSIRFTQYGESIIASFNGLMIGSSLWRVILTGYIEKSEPVWAKRIPYGRKEAYLIMNAEEQRCFDEAGLMESTDADVVEWWDSLAERERSKEDTSLIDVGREGERYTMLYEQQRTNGSPEWISIESNLAGYDILSRRTSDSDENILIEVKSSRKSMENAYCIVTRHEWETAQRKNNVDRYLFYLWQLSKGATSLAIIDVVRMQAYIPIDSGSGKWEEVRIPFAAFEDLFTVVVIDNH